MLLTAEGIVKRAGKHCSFPVQWSGWDFDMLPNMKRFKLRPSCECKAPRCDHPKAEWMTICDAGPFFQSSFLAAIDPETWDDPICSPDEYEIVKAGKSARTETLCEPGTPVDPTTISYNILENELLARLMTRLNEGFVAMGIKLNRNQWFGPGQAAQKWLLQEARAHSGEACRAAVKIKGRQYTEEELLDWGPFDAARRSYFGGWFEIMAHGPIPGDVYEYDINSAYPTIIAKLPCLLHGVWTHGENAPLPLPSRYVLVRADVEGSNPHIGAMPHRYRSGAVCRPVHTSGWYWENELISAKRAGLIDKVVAHEWWAYEPCDCPPPFAKIAQLYDQRLAVGKNTPAGRAMRLVYNSAYGKMAQSVGEPIFGNSVYASLITAGCRAMITDAIATHPKGSEAVVMVATDGVYFTMPHPTLDIHPRRLGAWDSELHENLSLLKPGVYWNDAGRKAAAEGGRLKLKSRGINAAALARAIPSIDAAWSSFVPHPDPKRWPTIPIEYNFQITTARQALHRGRWDTCGEVTHGGRVTQSAAPHRKRNGPFHRDPARGFLRSSPEPNRKGIPSVPYDKRFGLELKARIEEMPLLEEGEAAMLLDELLHG